ncbi:DUF2227 family putative metal-binding protein [Candidatus Bipolaricaulota bacterium]|nr:DUF2227 family putative metal-binding protein [Candidatus Bipolaricaulota bacterium]
MPAGKVHLVFELVTLPGWVLAGGLAGVEEGDLTVFSLSYVAASLLLSPDLDLARSDPSRRWGALRFLWAPYAALFRHRGISHSPLGPLTRVLYLIALSALVFLPLHLLAGVPLPSRFPLEIIPPMLAGVYLPHLLHVGLDRLVAGRKRYNRP